MGHDSANYGYYVIINTLTATVSQLEAAISIKVAW